MKKLISNAKQTPLLTSGKHLFGKKNAPWNFPQEEKAFNQ